MATMTETMRAIVAAADRRDRAAILALVTPDLEYHWHVGSPPIHGVEKFGRFLDMLWGKSQDNVWTIEAMAEAGDRLLVEGCETYTEVGTGRRVVNRYMGSLHFRDGRIAKWCDYFQYDPPPAAKAPAA